MSIILMILLLSVLVLVHELGHFIAARSFGIKVDRFGIGLPIGPTLYEKKFGDVTILIHAFLFGGYVSFPDDDKDSDIPQDSSERFINAPAYKRFIVFVAGVFANLLAALFFVIIAATIWGHLPIGTYQTYIKNIVAPKGASVWTSGLQKGDKIISINNSDATSKYTIYLYAQNSKLNDGKINSNFLENNYEKLKSINPAFERNEIIPKGILIKLPQKIDEPQIQLSQKVLKGMAVYKSNDKNLSVNQIKLRDKLQNKTYILSDGTINLNDVAYALSDGKKPLDITVERNNKQVKLKTIYPDKEGLIGVLPDIKEDMSSTKNVKDIIIKSSKYTYEQTADILVILKQLLTGKIPAKNLHGVVLVTKLGGDMISQEGLFYGLLLTAIISLNLMVFNLLPIPALDGGQIMFLVIEKLRGKPIKEETIEKISTVFFMLLIALIILVTFNDFWYLLTAKH